MHLFFATVGAFVVVFSFLYLHHIILSTQCKNIVSSFCLHYRIKLIAIVIIADFSFSTNFNANHGILLC